MSNITFEELRISLSSENIASYSNGVLTKLRYGTVTVNIANSGNVLGFNYNITFAPPNAFNATYAGVGRTDDYANMNVSFSLRDGNASVSYSGSYTAKDGSTVDVSELSYTGAYVEKTYGEATSTLLIYYLDIAWINDKPIQFAFYGEGDDGVFAVTLSNLPLNDGLTFRAICYMQR